MKRRMQVPASPADDRGAALLMVLVVVTVIALAGAAMLSFSDTSIRTTVALRDQGAEAYAAEGAAQVAISKLQQATFLNNCATQTGDALPLGNATNAFYKSAQSSSTALNAYVTCTPNPLTGNGVVVSAANKPADAIWTVLDDNNGVGQDYSSGSGDKFNVANGNVISEASIDIGSNTLSVTPTNLKVLAKPSTGCMKNGGGKFTPVCGTGAVGARPSYPAPTDPVSLALAPVCTNSRTYAAFYPGLYKDTTYLNGNCGQSDVVWFMPGTYYFDFPGNTPWNAPNRLIGGTPTDSTGTPISGFDLTNATTLKDSLTNLIRLAPTSPGACVNPREQSAPGVEFVFGGGSEINLGSHDFEICATYRADSVPIAIYGPTSAIPVNGGTATSPVGQRSACKDRNCSLLVMNTDGSADFHIQGFVYAPNARMELYLGGSAGSAFHWGLMLGSFQVEIKGTSPTNPFVELPPNGVGASSSYSVMYLGVWVCPKGPSPCDHSGPARLTAKVQVTGTPPAVTVLSWSVKR